MWASQLLLGTWHPFLCMGGNTTQSTALFLCATPGAELAVLTLVYVCLRLAVHCAWIQAVA